jgi:HAMP domain-containing protein
LHIAIRDLKTLAEMLGFFVARLLVFAAVCLLVVAVDGDHRLQNKIW